jgi:hypothetical protein
MVPGRRATPASPFAFRLFPVIALLPALLVIQPGCARASRASGDRVASVRTFAAVAGPHATVAGPAWIVWTRPRDEAQASREEGPRSTWITDDGHAEASQDGVELAIHHGLWRWQVTRTLVPSTPCPNAVREPSPGFTESARLVRRDGRGERRLPAGSPLDEAPEVERSVVLVGSVGTRLFVRDQTSTFACGAHGDWSATSHVYDGVTGRIDAIDTTALEGGTAATKDIAETRLEAKFTELQIVHDPAAARTATFVASEPRFSGGAMQIVDIFLADVPFAYGTSPFRSYAIDVEVPALPNAAKAMAQDLAAPDVVATFAASEPGRVVGGWTRVETDDVPRIRAAFVRVATAE